MNRRQFIKSSIGVAALAAMPVSVASAVTVTVKPVRWCEYELFQDAAGTIPVTDIGQPVGCMKPWTTAYGYILGEMREPIVSKRMTYMGDHLKVDHTWVFRGMK
jgi:hypothetical protein